jgi:hypothetical protein
MAKNGGDHGRGKSVVKDPRQSVHAARNHVQRARKSTGRLFMAGLGFSAAYFFDTEHGKERRKQLRDFIGRTRRSRFAESGESESELPRIGGAEGQRPTFTRAARV